MESTAPATGGGDSAASGAEPPSLPLAPQQAAAAAGGGGDTGSTSSATLLYLAGVGQAVGTDMEELRSMLEAFGALDDDGGAGAGAGADDGAIWTFEGKGYVLARFRDAQDAARAKAGLNGRVVQGRPLTVQYSSLGSTRDGETPLPPPEPLDPCDCAGVTVPGLELVEEFITPDEESALLGYADRDDGRHWLANPHPGMTRRVQHFGYSFSYATRGVDFEAETPAMPLDGVLGAIVGRLVRAGLLRMAPDQMTINEYLPGQGIAGHVETHDAFRDGLLSLSLSAPVVMDLREPHSGQRKAIYLAPRSALSLHGAARYLWAHAIAARTWDKVNGIRIPRTGRRVSFTLRRVIPPLPSPIHIKDGAAAPSAVAVVTEAPHPTPEQQQQQQQQQLQQQEQEPPQCLRPRRRPCLCPFPDRCPSSSVDERVAYLEGCRRGDGAILPPEARKPTPLERTNVHAVYETISTHWNHTRAIRRVHWPRVVGFLQSLPPHALIADIGCGDGKYLELRRYSFHPTAFALGCDRSVRLLACAAKQIMEGEVGEGEGKKEPAPEVFACDVLQVPFRDGAFDAALCIAVLHHLSTEAHRVQALRELCRVVRVGGVFDVHVWALEQEDGSRRRFDGQDQLVPFKMQAKYATQPLESLASTAAAAASASTGGTTTAAGGDGATTAANGPPPIVEAVPASVDAAAKLVTYERYCHVYREWELEGLLNKLGNEYELEIVDRGYDKGNWFVTVRKVGDALLPASSASSSS